MTRTIVTALSHFSLLICISQEGRGAAIVIFIPTRAFFPTTTFLVDNHSISPAFCSILFRGDAVFVRSGKRKGEGDTTGL